MQALCCFKEKEENMEDFPDATEWMNQCGNAGKSLRWVRRGKLAAWSKTLITAPKRPQMDPCQYSWTVLSKGNVEVRLLLLLTLNIDINLSPNHP